MNPKGQDAIPKSLWQSVFSSASAHWKTVISLLKLQATTQVDIHWHQCCLWETKQNKASKPPKPPTVFQNFGITQFAPLSSSQYVRFIFARLLRRHKVICNLLSRYPQKRSLQVVEETQTLSSAKTGIIPSSCSLTWRLEENSSYPSKPRRNLHLYFSYPLITSMLDILKRACVSFRF